MKYVLIAILALSVLTVGCDYNEAADNAEKVSVISGKGEALADKAGEWSILQPWASGTGRVLGGVQILTAALAVWLRKKDKKSTDALKTVLTAVDSVSGVGKTIVSAAIKDGHADHVESVYNTTKNV